MAQEREKSKILAVHYSAMAYEQARLAREAVKEARERLDRLVRGLLDSMRAGKEVSMNEVVEVSKVIGILDAADGYLVEALGFSISAKWRAKDVLGRDIRAEVDCANAQQCGELARRCNPEICPLFVVRTSE